MQTETANQFAQKLKENETPPQVLDVRTWPEYRSVHVKGAKLIPLNEVNHDKVRSAFPGNEPVHVLCKSGARARKAVEQLNDEGMDNLVLVEGGTDAAIQAGAPTMGSGGIGLTRQVQIVAGTFTLIGTLLGVTVNPWYLIVPGFFGAGLTFAGLTGKCAMAMILSHMPWNQRPTT